MSQTSPSVSTVVKYQTIGGSEEFSEYFPPSILTERSFQAPTSNASQDTIACKQLAGVGVGVEVLSAQGIVLVVDVFAGGPAANQGLIRIGDHLLEVDGKNVSRMEYSQILQLVAGPEDSSVTLKFLKSSYDRSVLSKGVTYSVDLVRKTFPGCSSSSDDIGNANMAFRKKTRCDSRNAIVDSTENISRQQNVNMLSPRPSRASPCKTGGVGLLIRKDIHDQRCYVQTVIEGGSAFQAGNIRVGDRLLEIDGNDVSSWTIEQIVRTISGPEGTVVTLTMQSSQECDRHSSKLVYSVMLTRSSDGYSSYKGSLLDAVSRSLMESFISSPR